MAIKGVRFSAEKGYPQGVLVPNPPGMQPGYSRGSTRNITKRSGFYACMSGKLKGTSPGSREAVIDNFTEAVDECLGE